MDLSSGVVQPYADWVEKRRVSGGQGLINQLRIYEIFEETKAAFHARFRDHAQRIMATHGFSILAMWETRRNDRTEFVYLLAWSDDAAKDAAWAAFMADEEWQEIKRETAATHGDLVGEIEDRVLQATDYSAALPARTGT